MLYNVINGGRKPERGSKSAAGYDLFANETITLPYGITKVKTGISLEIPEDFYGSIRERSGLALKGIKVCGGVIDSDYRGEIMVIMQNIYQEPYVINKGDKIAQIIFEKYYTFDIVEGDMSKTERGANGFGSTGN